MDDFISALKKINTDGLIYHFSKLSIELFNSNKPYMELSFPVIRYGIHQSCTVLLTGWDILNIEYLSVKYSNDYRHSERMLSPARLVELYRDYEDKSQSSLIRSRDDSNGVFRIVLGMTAEQFQYQNLIWIFERFSRNYYILVAAKNMEHRNGIDVDSITNEVFGLSAEDYTAVLVVLMWLCMKDPEPLSFPEELFKKKDNQLFTKENIARLVKYYSCDYKTLRSSSLGKQLLYSKPFVKTQRNTYFLSSLYSLGMTIGNGLYWVVRDYYRIQGTQKFVNAFGLLFEDYIIDIANKYCQHSEWQPLPKEKGKGADFLFSFADVQIVVEAKSALLQLDGKQQEPNDTSIKKFFNNTINEAYEQLQSSCSRLFSDTKESVVKVILLYDEFSNTAIIEESMRDLFYSDPQCFVITIRELEILLYLHKNDPKKCESIVHQMISIRKSESGRMNFGAILDDHQVFDNEHLKGEMDYFSILLEQYKG